MRTKLSFSLSLMLATCLIFPLLSVENPTPPADKTATELQAEEAERFFEATLYDKAILLYQELLPQIPSQARYYAPLRLRLAQCYFFTNQYDKIPELLSTSSDSEALLLLGITYNKLKQYDQAIATLSIYLADNETGTPPYYEEARYELGMAYFHAKRFAEAKIQFEGFSERSPKKQLFPLSRIYLARIAIAEERFLEAGRILHSLAKQIATNDTLRYAVSFLQGEILFHQKDWSQAAAHFEETLPIRNARTANWHEDTLYYLGWCYLNLGSDSNLSSENKAAYLEKAETIFRENLELYPSERAHLALGQCYLAQSCDLEQTNALKKLDALLTGKNLLTSREALQEALLLRAEASSSYRERKKFFRQLTQKSNAESPYYAKAWYLRGLNEFDEVQAHLTANRTNEAKKHLNNTIVALSTAFDLLYPSDKKLAALTLKYQAQAYSCQGTQEGYLKGIALVGKLLNRYRNDLFPTLDNPDEVYYLQAVNASHLIDKDDGNAFFEMAANSLSHTIESYPGGKYYDESLNLLGAMYYRHGDYEKAKKIYLKLAKYTPESPFTGEALFWTAHCIDNLGGDASESKRYRQQVFEQYPHTAFAGEAYFRYYPYHEYLKGSPEAMEHLNGFEAKFPESPFRSNAYYLIGLDFQQERKSEDGRSKREKNPSAAIEAFQKAEAAFDSLYCNNAIPENRLEYFITLRYRAILERALTSMKLSEEPDLESAEKILHRMYTDFENPNHSLAKALASGESYSRLQEECAYYLTKCYIKESNDKAAAKIIGEMIEKYRAAKITRGYYLSRLWHQQGIIHAKRNKNETALEDFTRAEDAGKGRILSSDELLDLWIQQSFCLRALGRTDEAMLLLSKVINFDAVSANRLKAMYLRAKIYEDQGRYELARKQLEATAQKAGPWAIKAKAKLEKNYVYQ